MNSLALLASLCLGWGTPAPTQSPAPVFNVAPSPDPTADFDDLQVAIDSVPDGSTLILEPGHHSSPEPFCIIDGKSLTILGRELHANPSSARIKVRNLGADQQVSLRGVLSFDAPGGLTGRAVLHAENCLGSLMVEDCDFRGTGGISWEASSALIFEDVALSQFVRCSFSSGTSYSGSAGASAWSDFQGRCGYVSGYCSNCTSGLVVGTGASVWTFGGSAKGSWCNSFGPVSSAGISVHIGASLTLRGTEAEAGVVPGGTAPDVDVESGGTFTEWTSITDRSLVTAHLVDAGAPIPFVASGEPGDVLLLYLDFEIGLLELPELSSLIGLQSPIFLFGPTLLDATGNLSLSMPAPGLPAGESLSAVIQGLYLPTSPGANPAAILGNPSRITAQG
ncbi:MAG: hypothetical protein ACYTFV_19015 [Planctomycetota bacterium]|jgi:hypothetical protein